MRNLLVLHTVENSNELRPGDLVLQPFTVSVVIAANVGSATVATSLRTVVGAISGGLPSVAGAYSLGTTGVISGGLVTVNVHTGLGNGTYLFSGYLVGRQALAD